MEGSRVLYPFYVMFHPVNGYEELKLDRKKGSVAVALGILALLFITGIVSRQGTGFVFNPNRPEKLNILFEFAKSIVPFALWVVANWSLCTLLDGEGRFSEICIYSAYAFSPIVLLTVPAVIVSNFMVLQEGTFLNLYYFVLRAWTLILLITAMKAAHQYTLKKTIVSMLLTVVGMCIIIFLAVLVTSLFQQLFIFLSTVYSEIMYRI